MSKKNSNLELWDAVCRTPKEKTKVVSQGRKYTTVNPQYQIRCATAKFGPYGSKWGFASIENTTMQIGEEILLTIKAVFFHPSGEFPITNSNKLLAKQSKRMFLDTDAYKKLETDTLTKALSRLGFNADIFEGLYDDPNYIRQLAQDEELTEKAKGAYIEKPKPTATQYSKIIGMLKDGKADIIDKAKGHYTLSLDQMAEMEQTLEDHPNNPANG